MKTKLLSPLLRPPQQAQLQAQQPLIFGQQQQQLQPPQLHWIFRCAILLAMSVTSMRRFVDYA